MLKPSHDLVHKVYSLYVLLMCDGWIKTNIWLVFAMLISVKLKKAYVTANNCTVLHFPSFGNEKKKKNTNTFNYYADATSSSSISSLSLMFTSVANEANSIIN